MDKKAQRVIIVCLGLIAVLVALGAYSGSPGQYDEENTRGNFILSGDEKNIVLYNGSNWFSIRASSSLAGNYDFVWPVDDGDDGKVLTTDGSGVLSFENIQLKRDTSDISNPPTDAQITTAFGTPASAGEGFVGIMDDNDAATNIYIVASTGTTADRWWYAALTQSAAAVAENVIYAGEDVIYAGENVVYP